VVSYKTGFRCFFYCGDPAVMGLLLRIVTVLRWR